MPGTSLFDACDTSEQAVLRSNPTKLLHTCKMNKVEQKIKIKPETFEMMFEAAQSQEWLAMSEIVEATIHLACRPAN